MTVAKSGGRPPLNPNLKKTNHSIPCTNTQWNKMLAAARAAGSSLPEVTRQLWDFYLGVDGASFPKRAPSNHRADPSTLLPADAHHFDVSCDDRPDCRIPQHHAPEDTPSPTLSPTTTPEPWKTPSGAPTATSSATASPPN